MAASILALSGGVGGAKLALGLARILPPDQLTVVCNTGDDFVHLGLNICPDLDTVLYTLADWNNKDLGWGQEDESWQFLEALERLGGEAWFRLGDRVMATHIIRTELLRAGHSLSATIEELSQSMGIEHAVVPMSDQAIRTRVHTRGGETLMFQHYFVRDRCEPAVTGFDFDGINEAVAAPGFASAIDHCDAVIVCPSNPFVSVDPILSIPGVVDALAARKIPVIVVSNIVGGQALKGPAAKMMAELGIPMTAHGVARHYIEKYGDLVSHFVIDRADASLEEEIASLGLRTIVTNTVMLTLRDKTELGGELLATVSSQAAG